MFQPAMSPWAPPAEAIETTSAAGAEAGYEQSRHQSCPACAGAETGERELTGSCQAQPDDQPRLRR